MHGNDRVLLLKGPQSPLVGTTNAGRIKKKREEKERRMRKEKGKERRSLNKQSAQTVQLLISTQLCRNKERPTRQLGNDPALWMREQKCALRPCLPRLAPNFSHLPALVPTTDLATFHSLEYPFSLSQMFLIFVRIGRVRGVGWRGAEEVLKTEYRRVRGLG